MKKAIVVGGSNGAGLAIAKVLEKEGYFLEICDRVEPEEGVLNSAHTHYHHCDLLNFDEDFFASFAKDPEIVVLVITAGIGRVADFSAHHIAEIEKTFAIDTVATIKILRIFYERIVSNQNFYTCVMGSISGWMISPAATVYAAAKAGVVRFIESVNIELEVSGTTNRILDISPASFKGSRFYGGKNNISVIEPLANEIVGHLFARDTIFIPQYNEVFKDVLDRYYNDPHEYGLYSYEYKKASDRFDNGKKVVIGYLSETFDLFNISHLNLLRKAKSQCDYLIVGVQNSGVWKDKETFIPFEERKAIIAACKYVDKVVDSCREDLDAWDLWHYDKLFVGSDYKGTDRFARYEKLIKDKKVEIVYIPYTQGTSTQIRDAILEHKRYDQSKESI